jgi:hypothetical protein
MDFIQYNGNDLMGLPTNKNHLNFKLIDSECKFLFSITRQGNAASCHFAANKKSMKNIIEIIKNAIKFIFDYFEWCTMIIAKIKLKKIERIVKDCGFKKILNTDQGPIYIRIKEWDF